MGLLCHDPWDQVFFIKLIASGLLKSSLCVMLRSIQVLCLGSNQKATAGAKASLADFRWFVKVCCHPNLRTQSVGGRGC